MLDAIDLAYLKGEFPMMVVSAGPSSSDRVALLEILSNSRSAAIVLPDHFKIEFIEPCTPQHPWELARWADDGGRV